MNTTKKNQVVSVRMPTDIHSRYQSLAKTTNRSISYYLNQALGTSISELEEGFLTENNLTAKLCGKNKNLC